MKKIAILGILVLIMSVFVHAVPLAAPNFTLSASSGDIKVDQGQSNTLNFDIVNSGDTDFTNVELTFSQDSFQDDIGNNIDIVFSSNGFTLDQGNTQNIIVTATPELDHYLGRFTGDITITATTATTDPIVKTFSLTVDTTSDLVRIELDDSDLDDLQPGDDIKFEVDVNNIAGKDLENIDVKAWIIDIDDNDNLDDTSSKEDIDKSDDYQYDFEFVVPLNVDDEDFDLKIRVRGEDTDGNDFEAIQIFKGVVEVVKDKDEEVQFDNLDMTTIVLTCGTSFMVDIDAINTGSDDLNNMYLKLEIEGTSVSIRSDEFDLDSDKHDKREDNIEFRVNLPNDLDQDTYNLKILAYNDNNKLVGGEYKVITVSPCEGTSVSEETTTNTNEETTTTNTEENQGTVFLPSSFSVAGLDKNTWSTIFWIIGDIVLVLVAIYFITLIFRRRN